MQFSVFQQSRQGGRKCNEDRMGYCYTRDSAVLMLADGLGGHPEGEVAAHLAVAAVATMFQKMAQPKLADMDGFLENAMMAAHYQILNYAVDKAMRDSPRTTLVMAVIQSGQVIWAHCGDSQALSGAPASIAGAHPDHTFAERRSPQRSNAPQRRLNSIAMCCSAAWAHPASPSSAWPSLLP